MVQKFNSIEDILNNCPDNQTICDNLVKAWAIINSPIDASKIVLLVPSQECAIKIKYISHVVKNTFI